MIVRYWAGTDIDMDYRSLHATLGEARAKAQLELCFGQLLIAARHDSAWSHLDAGFVLAANIMEPEEYFIILKRHERLRSLPLYPQPRPSAGLQQLLTEAGIIERLRGGRTPSPDVVGHGDTVG
jgi:hypothetical protein